VSVRYADNVVSFDGAFDLPPAAAAAAADTAPLPSRRVVK